jgi:hypothetical protein
MSDETRSGVHAPSGVELTILMPCLNEAETIGTCIAKARSYLARAEIQGEVLIADNGSTDGSQAIAETLGARVIPVPARGYGAALMGGIAEAQGRFIIMGDADDSYDFANLDPFVEALRAGADLAMGNRFKGGIRPGAMPPLHRILGNPVLSFLGRLFFKIPVGDFHCGLRGFRADRIRELGLQTTGMEFASEMVVKSALSRFRIAEVPTTLDPDGRTRAPHLKTWRDGWRHLKFLLMYSPRWLFMVPGGVLLGLGGVLSALLFWGPLALPGGIVLDTNTFIAADFMVMLGVQLLTVGGLSRYYATVAGLLPRSERADRLVRLATTDRLAQAAGLVVLLGAGLFAAAMKMWADVNFGPLDSPVVPRMVIASLTLVVIGVQTFFFAFLLGILSIPTRPNGLRLGS